MSLITAFIQFSVYTIFKFRVSATPYEFTSVPDYKYYVQSAEVVEECTIHYWQSHICK